MYGYGRSGGLILGGALMVWAIRSAISFWRDPYARSRLRDESRRERAAAVFFLFVVPALLFAVGLLIALAGLALEGIWPW